LNLNLVVLWTDQSRRPSAIDAPSNHGFGLYRHFAIEYSTLLAGRAGTIMRLRCGARLEDLALPLLLPPASCHRWLFSGSTASQALHLKDFTRAIARQPATSLADQSLRGQSERIRIANRILWIGTELRPCLLNVEFPSAHCSRPTRLLHLRGGIQIYRFRGKNLLAAITPVLAVSSRE